MEKSAIEFEKKLEAHTTPIPGLIVYDIPVHGDNRGWFKENWQREKMIALGLPDFGPVQNNISFNNQRGATRGIHAEPWDKYISIAAGSIFGAWVDLREGETFGATFTTEMDPSKAIFVPRGVGNSYQALEDNTVYTYLVNEHWSAEAQSQYTFLNLADMKADIQWPIPLDQAELSEKDLHHQTLAEVTPMKPRKILVTGANGQLGKALRIEFPEAEFTTHDDLDITSNNLEASRTWRQYETIINTAAYTAVDKSETTDGRIEAWRINATAVANLGKIATKYGITLIHISSDYVFDGTRVIHDEDEPYSPLSVYGQSKAAGDVAISQVPRHYNIRTSWVIGDGNNFVRTMKSLAEKGIKPSVVDDQIGRLSFTSDIAKGIKHLVYTKAPYGTYNISNDGESVSWADIAKLIFETSNKAADDVTPVSTEEYYANKTDIAPRPLQSTLSLDKIKATGFMPRDWHEALEGYLTNPSN